jgi:Tol biopolymer transport system component
MSRAASAAVLFSLLLLAAATARYAGGLDAPPVVQRVSVAPGGGDAHGGPSKAASVNDSGRYVVFASDATDLIGPDLLPWRDIFLRDRQLNLTERISISSAGVPANGNSGGFPTLGIPRISEDGRYVVFASEATNLAPNDDNSVADVFLRDRLANTTERVVDVPSNPIFSGPISIAPDVSDDGRFVAFSSYSPDLVPDDLNNTWDVFLKDRQSGALELISQATDGTHGEASSGYVGAGTPRISSDGRFVIFGSVARDLVEGETESYDDIFLRDRASGTTDIVSLSDDEQFGNDHSTYGDVSDDGRYVVFASIASNLVSGDTNGCSDIFLRDRQLGTTARITAPASPPCDSRFPSISDDGAYIVFQSDAATLVPGDANATRDVFRYSTASSMTQRISVPLAGEAHGVSERASINVDGAVVAFESAAADLVPNDGNGLADIFAWGKPLSLPPTPTNTPAVTATPTALPCPARGDVNKDGTTNSLDALLVLQSVAGLLPSLPNDERADANNDGEITAIDAALILQYGAGLVACLPA